MTDQLTQQVEVLEARGVLGAAGVNKNDLLERIERTRGDLGEWASLASSNGTVPLLLIVPFSLPQCLSAFRAELEIQSDYLHDFLPTPTEPYLLVDVEIGQRTLNRYPALAITESFSQQRRTGLSALEGLYLDRQTGVLDRMSSACIGSWYSLGGANDQNHYCAQLYRRRSQRWAGLTSTNVSINYAHRWARTPAPDEPKVGRLKPLPVSVPCGTPLCRQRVPLRR